MRESILTLSLITVAIGASLLPCKSSAEFYNLDEADLLLNSKLSVLYLSNPYLRDRADETEGAVEDTFAFVIDPTLSLKLGSSDSRFSIDGELGLAIRETTSLPELDAEDIHFSLDASYQADRSSWSMQSSYTENSMPDHETRSISNATQSSLRWSGSYRYSSKSRLAAEIVYTDMSFDDQPDINYNDSDTFALPIRALYRISEDLEVGAGARFRNRSDEFNPNTKDTAWQIALSGKLSSKVNSDLRLGYLDQSTIGKNGLFVSGSLNWKTSDSTNLELQLSRDTHSTSFAFSTLRERASLNWLWKLSEKLTFKSNLSLVMEDYQGLNQVENQLGLNAGLFYESGERFYSSVNLGLNKTNSNQLNRDYEAMVANFANGWRF